MGYWETSGKSDDWYTPKYIFDALGCRFDCDVANGMGSKSCVPAANFILCGSLEAAKWEHYEFIWLNPPFGGRNGIVPWLDKFFEHGNGIALTPDRTSAPWFQDAASKADAILFIAGKVKFIRPDGTHGNSPSNGTALFAAGSKAVAALLNAEKHGLGFVLKMDVAA